MRFGVLEGVAIETEVEDAVTDARRIVPDDDPPLVDGVKLDRHDEFWYTALSKRVAVREEALDGVVNEFGDREPGFVVEVAQDGENADAGPDVYARGDAVRCDCLRVRVRHGRDSCTVM